MQGFESQETRQGTTIVINPPILPPIAPPTHRYVCLGCGWRFDAPDLHRRTSAHEVDGYEVHVPGLMEKRCPRCVTACIEAVERRAAPPPAFKRDTAYHELTGKPGEAEMLEAGRLVNGERQADYGTPKANYDGVAKVWSGILSGILARDITAAEAALMMVGLKLQRQAMKHKRDNLVDAHGYLLVYAHIQAEED